MALTYVRAATAHRLIILGIHWMEANMRTSITQLIIAAAVATLSVNRTAQPLPSTYLPSPGGVREVAGHPCKDLPVERIGWQTQCTRVEMPLRTIP